MKRKRKLTGLATIGLLSLSLGGTMVLSPNVTPTVTAQAATSLSEAKTKLNALTDKAKVIINYKGVEEYDKQTMQADLELADDAIKSGDANQMNQAIGIIAKDVGDFDSNGKRIKDVDSQPGFDDSADNAIRPGSASDSSSDDSGYTTDEVEGGTNTDPIKDTQDRKEYEESTAKDDQDSNTSNSDTSDSNGDSNVAGNSSTTDKNGSSSFSKQSVNAPGNAGSTTDSSSTSNNSSTSNIPSPTKTNSKKGNLPGTDEDKTQPVLIATIGLLGILGLGGTAFALWLRQRKHVNNE